MTTLEGGDAARQTLAQWASENALKEAQLSEDGQILTRNDASIRNQLLTIEFEGKSCQYTLASIFLQIIDPDQGLVAYRNVCKKYNAEPIKALDKPTVVGYFLGSSGETAEAAPEPKEPEPVEEKPKTERKRSKHEHRSHKDSARKDKHRSGHRERRSSEERATKKKKAALVTNEQLFSNLNVVVDKRHLEQKSQEAITKALSSEGFEVSPELLEEHRETTQAILSNEIPVGNSQSILRATNPKKNLSRVLELYMETVNPTKKKPSGSRPVVPVASKPKKAYLVGKKPVIVVPKGMTAPITLINAHEFFCNGHFIPRDVMIKQGRQRTPATTFTRNVRRSAGSTGLLEYEIMDNPKKLGSDPKEWERIVAVVVLGQDWQFKDWPQPYNKPVHLFAKTFGFYTGMEGSKLPKEVQGWAVKQAWLNRDKRGLDSVSFASFWNGLDEFMSVHKPELLPQQEA